MQKDSASIDAAATELEDPSPHLARAGCDHVSLTDFICADTEVMDEKGLLKKIKEEREDLEAKISSLKHHINTCSNVMKKLKQIPGSEQRYNTLSDTRASLVKNAVCLQQVLIKIKQSESQADSLADRETILTAEMKCRLAQNGDVCDAQSADSPQQNNKHTEDDNDVEVKETLLKRIQQSQSQLKLMEIQQHKLKSIKAEIQKKLQTSRQNDDIQNGCQESEEPGLSGAGGHSAAAQHASAPCLAPGPACCPVAGPCSLAGPQRSRSPSGELRHRLTELERRRRQVEEMLVTLSQLRRHRPPLTAGVDGQECELFDREDEDNNNNNNNNNSEKVTVSQETDASVTSHLADDVTSHLADSVTSHRRRLHQLEHLVQSLTLTLNLNTRDRAEEEREGMPEEQSKENGRLSLHHHQQPLQQQEVSDVKAVSNLADKQREVDTVRQQLSQMRQLMTSVEEARNSGHRLCDAVPNQLTQLLSLSDQASAGSSAESDKRGAEYVHLLKNMHASVDSIKKLHQKAPP